MMKTASELGAADGRAFRRRVCPTIENRVAIAAASGRTHLEHVIAGRLESDDILDYCKAFLSEALDDPEEQYESRNRSQPPEFQRD